VVGTVVVKLLWEVRVAVVDDSMEVDCTDVTVVVVVVVDVVSITVLGAFVISAWSDVVPVEAGRVTFAK
jgi:hypothetical protein